MNPAVTAGQGLQMLERLHRMDVRRVDVKDIVVYAAHQRAELGNHRGNEPDLVELRDGRTASKRGFVDALQEGEEELRRLLRILQPEAPPFVWGDARNRVQRGVVGAPLIA